MFGASHIESNVSLIRCEKFKDSQSSFIFLIIKPTRCNNFSNLFLEWNSTCVGQFLCPSSGVFHCTRSSGICHTGLLTACELEQMLQLTSCQQTCMTYIIPVCTVKNSWWWKEELSETCRISFQGQIWEISASSWFYYKKVDTMRGHMNVKFSFICSTCHVVHSDTGCVFCLKLKLFFFVL